MLLSSLLWGKKSWLPTSAYVTDSFTHSFTHSLKQRLSYKDCAGQRGGTRWPDPDSARFASFSAVLAVVRCFSESHQTLQLTTELSGFSVLEIWAALQCASRHPQGLSGMGHRPWEFSHISTCFPFFFDSPFPPGSISTPGLSLEGPAPLFPVYSLP